jgi:molybdate transport system regulatory protein
MSARPSPRLLPRLRVLVQQEIALGPGKADLLGHIAGTGSLSQAARRMEMSYMKAWLLVQVMNRCFKSPLVTLERGGSSGGGARLTPAGEEALHLYRTMEKAALDAMTPSWERLHALLRTTPKKEP